MRSAVMVDFTSVVFTALLQESVVLATAIAMRNFLIN